MAVLFLIFFGSDLSKMDQTWSNWISHQSKNFTIKSSHIYKKDKNGCFILDFFWIRSVQNGSNLIKLAQIGFLTNQKMFLYKVVTFTTKIKIAILFLITLDQICPKWIKLDQTWSNWISHQSKNITIKNCHIYREDKNDYFVFDFFGSDLSKMDQTW